ncbi:vacuolar protein sorting-associated protein 35C-like isoform X3 [Tripterygium wilfordii]|uniref:vacuolar protein sorting-associated protein 35C-like isoform X3 n=1 Tax=Tripterygium wilfordii TaxID=458696 RepID=UPI0018F817A0|nr:vacuolar protein sorting-associated protein 35C-like isoform X3 [Tripterygium wilfordii]
MVRRGDRRHSTQRILDGSRFGREQPQRSYEVLRSDAVGALNFESLSSKILRTLKLEMFFKDESKHGVTVIDLYELVQHASNILPRICHDGR